jgi:2-amino-4-hydroxy-6-hydroxymethyldihydropteridine diphosphokinase
MTWYGSRIGTAGFQVAKGSWPQSSPPLVVALGSNVGDRVSHFRAGLEALEVEGIHIEAVSGVYETPPIGFLDQPSFFNMVALARTRLPYSGLLSIFQRVEENSGRRREFRNAPRTLDLDLILLGDLIVREEGLQVPHPRWKGRSFVVRPLAEIAPGMRDPETGWEVQEIARKWAMEPEEIRVVPLSGVFGKE